MAQLGKRNLLTVLRSAPPGLYLDGGTHGEILLPGKFAAGAAVGGKVEVFVYRDSEDRLVATTEKPRAVVGEFACLRVVSINPRIGVFLDWGLGKDLFMPVREQDGPVRPDEWIIVQVMHDERSDRLIATARLNRRLNLVPPPYREGESVHLLVVGRTPLGYKLIINHAHWGLIYSNEVSAPLKIGSVVEGYVRAVRPDGKIDLALGRAGYRRVATVADQVLEKLKAAGGRMPFHDGSDPEAIRATFGVSKKAFKQAIGGLFRDRVIFIDPDGIRLVEGKKP